MKNKNVSENKTNISNITNITNKTNKTNNNEISKNTNNKSKIFSSKISEKNSNIKENFSNLNNLINVASNSQSSSKLDNIENLISIHNSLEFLNLQLINTFENQKSSTDKLLLEKINELIKLREYNFTLSSKLNNLNTIQQIESYLNVIYSKIVSCAPKVDNILENIEDLKTNINYGLDRLYLEDNLVCDESELKTNLELATNSMQNLAVENSDKLVLIQEIKDKYSIYYEQLRIQKQQIEILDSLMKKFKKNSLDEKIDEIAKFLKRQNNKLENDLFI